MSDKNLEIIKAIQKTGTVSVPPDTEITKVITESYHEKHITNNITDTETLLFCRKAKNKPE